MLLDKEGLILLVVRITLLSLHIRFMRQSILILLRPICRTLQGLQPYIATVVSSHGFLPSYIKHRLCLVPVLILELYLCLDIREELLVFGGGIVFTQLLCTATSPLLFKQIKLFLQQLSL